MKRMPIDRRTFLRGCGLAGVSVALPVLDAMADAHGRLRERDVLGTEPRRLALLHWPQGLPVGWGAADGGWWYPTTYGAGYQVTPGLQPLVDAGVIDDVNVLLGLTYRQLHASVGSHGHCAAYMTGYAAAPEAPGSAEPTTFGPSVDQVAAQRLGGQTPFASVATGLYEQGEG